MKKVATAEETCVASLKLLGDFWTLRIIDALQYGGLRYCELQRHVDNLNPVTLTARLKKLEETGLVSRSEDLEDKISVSYSLTEIGTSALPILRELDKFSAKLEQAQG